ncbi:hypothetical protein IAR55_005196 [Kwoniella newhampshirensis]|uniref:Uncharacterized protein n=1 Tax=Kwoniella newhampshirensis TaxID=1651941 RepID=A0AAW0YHB2_9TREE
MPIHPAPIILGTLAVIGSGYAFKKYIYDPHLAPLIEALLAQHAIASTDRHATPERQIPVPVPASSASTTSRQHHQTHLRRRSHARRYSSEYELNESLLHHQHQHRVSHNHDHDHEQGENAMREAAWVKTSLYDMEGSRLSSPNKGIHRRRDSDNSRHIHPTRKCSLEHPLPVHVAPLIDLDDAHRPESPQDAEVREVIFNYAPTPLHHSGTSTSARSSSPSINPFLSNDDVQPSPSSLVTLTSPGQVSGSDQRLPPAPSTTFSFLSLSQQSSPESMNVHLESLSFGTAAELVNSTDTGRERRVDLEDDVISLPETSISGYEDAESYSPISRGLSPAPPTRSTSPTSTPTAHSRSQADCITPRGASVARMQSSPDPIGELGMSYVIPPSSVFGRRGPMSVVSMTESDVEDGWRSESEWEAVSSDAGH